MYARCKREKEHALVEVGFQRMQRPDRLGIPLDLVATTSSESLERVIDLCFLSL
jgi:hypothetical protein